MLAGLGCATILRTAGRLVAGRGAAAARLAQAAAGAALLAGPLHAVVSTHPHGIAYYNAFLGGLSGARERGIPDATDYWGASYWQGLAWIADRAEPNAGIVAPLATHVVRCGAPVRAPDGPPVLRAGDPEVAVVYLMYVTRDPAYGPLLRAFDGRVEPTWEIRVQGAPILRVLRLEGDEAREAQAMLRQEGEALRSAQRILAWLKEHPGEAPAVMQAVIDPEARAGDALRRLQSLLPERLHADAEALLWTYRPGHVAPSAR